MTRFSIFRFALAMALLTFFSSFAWAQLPTPVNSVMSDVKPGSVLFFPKYTSNPSSPQTGDTQINITNTNTTSGVSLHLFAVDGSTCSVADSFVGLTPNQTASFRISDFDPGVTGYLVAVVVGTDGPSQFNYLIGSEYVRESDGRSAFLQAYTVARISNTPSVIDANGNAILAFNGTEYERLPNVLALNSFNSQTTDNTQVNILSPGNNLINGETPGSNSLFTLVYDDTERAFSTSVRVVCYNTFNLTSLRVTGGGSGINSVVPAGRTGWIRFSTTSRPILGAMLNRGPVFTGGLNLHILGVMNSYSITVPNF